MSLILVIEDEFDVRTGLTLGLRRAGFDVIDAEDGNEGYALILNARPDLVLCDINMPGIRGDALLSRLRREHPDLARMPFLFLTALTDRESIILGCELGADDYLTKPVDLDILAAIVSQKLGQAIRWEETYSNEIEIERARFLIELSEQTRLSFLSAADVLNHLSEGVILFGAGCRVIFINHAARRILSEEDGLALRRGGLGAATQADSIRIRDLLSHALSPGRSLADAVGGTTLGIERPSGRRPYTLRISHLEPGLDLGPEYAAWAAIFISDPEAPTRLSAGLVIALYGFTPTEGMIVTHLASGLSVSEVAEKQHISRNTVHHHLKSIFRKTNTKRQSELISLVLSGIPSNNAKTREMTPPGF